MDLNPFLSIRDYTFFDFYKKKSPPKRGKSIKFDILRIHGHEKVIIIF